MLFFILTIMFGFVSNMGKLRFLYSSVVGFVVESSVKKIFGEVELNLKKNLFNGNKGSIIILLIVGAVPFIDS